MDWNRLRQSLCLELQQALQDLPAEDWQGLEEIRLRLGQPVRLQYQGQDKVLKKADKLMICDRQLLQKTLQVMTGNSLYACEDELRQGFLTLPGGHRVGLCGEAVLEHGCLRTLKNFSGLNLRLARFIPGAAAKILPWLLTAEAEPMSALLLAPPGVGKTTVLRDFAGCCRKVSAYPEPIKFV